jgi:F-type H+-transporting ATPase subunit b
MSTESTSASKVPPIVFYVLGALLMVGGTYVSLQNGNLKSLEEQGIPLDLGKTVATIGVFLILFQVLNAFFFKPLGDAIHGRTAELEKTFAEAESLRAEMTKMKSDYEARLASTEASAREQIQSQVKEAQALAAGLRAEAQGRADALISAARQEIETEKAKLLIDLRTHVVDLAIAGAEKIIGANMDNDANRRLVDEFINKVEVAA